MNLKRWLALLLIMAILAAFPAHMEELFIETAEIAAAVQETPEETLEHMQIMQVLPAGEELTPGASETPGQTAEPTAAPTPEESETPAAEATPAASEAPAPSQSPESGAAQVEWAAPEEMQHTGEGVLRDDNTAFEVQYFGLAPQQPLPRAGLESIWQIEYSGGIGETSVQCAFYAPHSDAGRENSYVLTEACEPDGEGKFAWTPGQSGNYIVRIALKDENENIHIRAGYAFSAAEMVVIGDALPEGMIVGSVCSWQLSVSGMDDGCSAACEIYTVSDETETLLAALAPVDGLNFTWTPGQSGSYMLHAEVFDASGVECARIRRPFTVSETPYFHVPVTEISLLPGETFSIGASSNMPLAYAVSDAEIATVDAGGVLAALRPGHAVVTITAENGASAQVSVSVNVPETTALIPAQTSLVIGIGEKVSLNVAAQPQYAQPELSYSSSRKKCVSVDADGIIKGRKRGTAIITVKADNGVEAEVTVTVFNAPRKVSVILPGNQIGVGDHVHCAVEYNSGAAGSYTLASSDENILRVEGNRLIAVAPGEAKITARAFNGRTGTAILTVMNAPESIEFANAPVIISAGDSCMLSCVLSDGSAGTVKFYSDRPEIAAVDETSGLLTAIAQGSAVITAETHNGLQATLEVTVRPAPTGVALPHEQITLGVGEQYKITPAILPEDAVSAYTYARGRTSSVKVSADGVVSGAKRGTAAVTVSTYNGQTATVNVTVRNAPKKVTLTLPRNAIGVGESIGCSVKYNSGAAGGYVLISSDENIVRVEENRLVAVAPGEVNITARSFNGRTSSAILSVMKAPESIAFANDPITIGAGDKSMLSCVLSEGSIGTVKFRSDRPEIAAVDETSGQLTAIAQGSAVITAETHNGLQATLEVTVRPAPTGVALPHEQITLGVGEQYKIKPAISPEDAFSGYTYLSSRTRNVQVSADGVISGIRRGTAAITVSTYNGQKATVRVTVVAAPSSITAKASRTVLGVGETAQAGYELPKNTFANVYYSSEPAGIIDVSPEGRITALGPGSANLIARTHNGISGSVKIEVFSAPEYLVPAAQTLETGVGATVSFSAALPENTAGSFRYESADSLTAAVDPKTGAVTGVNAGITTIRAIAYNGAYGECTVYVKPAPESISINAHELELLVGGEYTFNAEAVPAEAFVQLFCTSDNPDAVTANGSTIRAVGAGSAVITVANYNGLSSSCTVTVPEAPDEIWLDENHRNIASGEQFILGYSITPGTFTIVSFASSNPDVASVDAETGLVTGVAPGTAIITAYTLNGMRDICMVNVDITTDSTQMISGEFEITFMNIGRNDGILIQCGGENAFIDAGRRSYGLQAVDYMNSVGVKNLKYYIGTHAHQDHVGSASTIINAIDTELIIIPHEHVENRIKGYAHTDEEKAAAANAVYQIVRPGDMFYLGGAKFECIGPINILNVSAESGRENHNSLVLRVTYGSNTFLLTADATAAEIKQINEINPDALKAQVLKNPHHQARLEKLIDICRPEITVISTHKRALPRVGYVNYIKELGSEVYITANNRDGHVKIVSDGSNLAVQTQY